MLKLIDKIWTWVAVNWPVCLIWIGGAMLALAAIWTVVSKG